MSKATFNDVLFFPAFDPRGIIKRGQARFVSFMPKNTSAKHFKTLSFSLETVHSQVEYINGRLREINLESFFIMGAVCTDLTIEFEDGHQENYRAASFCSSGEFHFDVKKGIGTAHKRALRLFIDPKGKNRWKEALEMGLIKPRKEAKHEPDRTSP